MSGVKVGKPGELHECTRFLAPVSAKATCQANWKEAKSCDICDQEECARATYGRVSFVATQIAGVEDWSAGLVSCKRRVAFNYREALGPLSR